MKMPELFFKKIESRNRIDQLTTTSVFGRMAQVFRCVTDYVVHFLTDYTSQCISSLQQTLASVFGRMAHVSRCVAEVLADRRQGALWTLAAGRSPRRGPVASRPRSARGRPRSRLARSEQSEQLGRADRDRTSHQRGSAGILMSMFAEFYKSR